MSERNAGTPAPPTGLYVTLSVDLGAPERATVRCPKGVPERLGPHRYVLLETVTDVRDEIREEIGKTIAEKAVSSHDAQVRLDTIRDFTRRIQTRLGAALGAEEATDAFQRSAIGSRPSMVENVERIAKHDHDRQAPMVIEGACATWDAQERDLAGQGLASVGHLMLGAMMRGFDHRYIRVTVEAIDPPKDDDGDARFGRRSGTK